MYTCASCTCKQDHYIGDIPKYQHTDICTGVLSIYIYIENSGHHISNSETDYRVWIKKISHNGARDGEGEFLYKPEGICRQILTWAWGEKEGMYSQGAARSRLAGGWEEKKEAGKCVCVVGSTKMRELKCDASLSSCRSPTCSFKNVVICEAFLWLAREYLKGCPRQLWNVF